MKTAAKSCQQHKPTLSVDPTATPPSAACTNSLRPTSDFDVDGVALHDLPLSADGVDGLADVVPLVVVRRLVDHQPVLVAALQHLTKGIRWMRSVNLDLTKWVTYLVCGQLLEPLVFGQRVALRGAGQDGPVVDAHRRAARRGHPEDLGRVWGKTKIEPQL